MSVDILCASPAASLDL